MAKIFDSVKMKVMDAKIESNIKKLDTKYLKSGKIDNLVLNLNGKVVDLLKVRESYKYLQELSKLLLEELDKAIEYRAYKGYEDKNGTYDNLVEITNCLRLVKDSKSVSSIAGEFFKASGNPKTSVNKSLKIISESKKGFLAKPKIKDILVRTFAILKKVAFAPIDVLPVK